MVDIVLSTDDVTVLGGPANVSVDVGIGAAGIRGSQILQGNADPNTLTSEDFISTPLVYDLFLVVDPSSPDYLQFYQYVNRDGDLIWDKILKLSPSTYAINKVIDFVDGEATFNINLYDLDERGLIFTDLVDTYALFNIQVTLSNYDITNPISVSNPSLPAAVSVYAGDVFSGAPEGDPAGDYVEYLPVTVNAAEWDGSSWASIDAKSVAAHITISLVDSSEVITAAGSGGS
jgi:hypothetical protein